MGQLLTTRQRTSADLHPYFMTQLLLSQMGQIEDTVPDLIREYRSRVRLRSDLNLCREAADLIFRFCIAGCTSESAIGMDQVGLYPPAFEEFCITDIYQNLYSYLLEEKREREQREKYYQEALNEAKAHKQESAHTH